MALPTNIHYPTHLIQRTSVDSFVHLLQQLPRLRDDSRSLGGPRRDLTVEWQRLPRDKRETDHLEPKIRMPSIANLSLTAQVYQEGPASPV